MESTSRNIKNKRIVDQHTKFEQEIIDYMKRAVLSSKIILDEDFDVLIDAPLLFPAVIKNSYRFYLNMILSISGLIGVQSCNQFNFHSPYTAAALLPIGYEVFHLFRRCINKRCNHKQIDNFVKSLENHASLNHKVLKHLYKRIKILDDLQEKVNSTVIKIIQEEDEQFANFAAEMLETTCKTLQQQLIIQTAYSDTRYSSIGNWHLESCAKNSSIQEVTNYIARNSELYILLASTFMSSAVLGLEVAMWRSHADFGIVFRTIKETVKAITHSMSAIESQLQKVFSGFNDSIGLPPKTKEKNRKSIYTDKMEDCNYCLRLCFDLSKIIESQNPKTRCILLQKMLDNFEQGSTIVKNLLKYEQSHEKTIPKIESSGNFVKEQNLEDVRIPENEENQEVESDDETFAYSPLDSDNDIHQNSTDQKNGEVYEDSKIAAAVQGLMLLELKNRMKDVRRIKIVKTSSGDLIVQERPITLLESGGEIQSEVSEESSVSDLKVCRAKPSLTCIQLSHNIPAPPSGLRFSLTNQRIVEEDESEMSPRVPDTSLLVSIAAMAKQRKQNEEVFDYIGEDYVGSDMESDAD